MPDISVTDDQRERLQQIQNRLAEDIAYGHVRPRDAVEYLLDHEGETRTRPESAETAGAASDDASFGGGTGSEVRNGDSVEPDDDDDRADDSEDVDDETRLNSVMSLLDDYDDVWRETDSGEEKYEVDLPDGTTERARTKDDVRALLFKHYR